MNDQSVVLYARYHMQIPDVIPNDDLRNEDPMYLHNFTIENMINRYYSRLHRRKKNMLQRKRKR